MLVAVLGVAALADDRFALLVGVALRELLAESAHLALQRTCATLARFLGEDMSFADELEVRLASLGAGAS